MSSEQTVEGSITVTAENIGGIDSTNVTIRPGITVLSGRNATNRTSFLQAIMAALGSDNVSLKGDADEGYAEVTIGNETYTRTLSRTNGAVAMSGEPYFDDPVLADLFAFLTETNEARQAVARGDDLRELIMRPVDTEAIQSEIEQLQIDSRDLEKELETLENLEGRIPPLEDKHAEIEAQIADKEEELEAKEAEIESIDIDVAETREQQSHLDEKLEDLRALRSQREECRYELETERESLAALEDELQEIKVALEEYSDTPADVSQEYEAELARLRDHKRSLESTISQLQNIIQFNENLLEDNRAGLQSVSEAGPESETAVPDRLLPEGEKIVCWTCGSEVNEDAVTETLEQLREFRQEKVQSLNTVSDELSDVKDRQAELEEHERQLEQLTHRRDRIENEMEEREAKIEDLVDRRDDLEAEIDETESAVEDLQEQEYDELLELHREANQLEFELGQLERDRSEIDTELQSIDERLAERDQLQEQHAAYQEELTDLRTRIEQIETAAVDQFNEHMSAVLDVLEYANLERIWVERVEREAREGRRKVSKSTFDLHVVRSTDSGTTYEDTIDHLSESEREVTGLVFALAGYLVHNVHEVVPVMLLDSLEALDAGRVAELIEYFKEYADCLIVALLPEDAAALDDSYHRITEI